MDSDDYLHHEATTLRVNHTLKKGSSILIPCEYIDNKHHKATLVKGSRSLNDYNKLISDDLRLNLFKEYNLVIPKVNDTYAGNYSCILKTESLKDGWLQPHKPINYELKVFDSQNKTNRAEDEFFRHDSLLVKVVANESVTLPCQVHYYNQALNSIEWSHNGKLLLRDRHIKREFSKSLKVKLLEGYTLEIQNVGSQDNGSEYICERDLIFNRKEPDTTIHKLEVLETLSNETRGTCSPSPCGLNSECALQGGHVTCLCRKNYEGEPPNCRRDCGENCGAETACISERCKAVCSKSCGQHMECIIQNYKYVCVCKNDNSKRFCRDSEELPIHREKRFITKNQTFTVSINSNVIFPCQVLGGVFYEKLVWEKTPQNADFLTTLNIQQPKMQLYLQNNLRINQVTNEEAGYYFCGIKGKLELNGNLSNSLYRIYKLEFPGVKLNDSRAIKTDFKPHHTISAKINDTIILPCEGLDVNKNNHFYAIDSDKLDWTASLYNGKTLEAYKKPFSSSDYFYSGAEYINKIEMIKGENLEIQSVQLDDAGIYSCAIEVMSMRGSQKLRIFHTLEVIDPPNSDDPCIKNPCGVNSDCYPKNNERQCSCRANYHGKPPHCQKKCIYSNCDWIGCANKYCKNLCQQSCGSNNECRIQNYTYTCLNTDYKKIIQSQLPDSGVCGAECIALSTAAATIFFVLLIGTILLIKRQRRKRRIQRESTEFKMDGHLSSNATHSRFHDFSLSNTTNSESLDFLPSENTNSGSCTENDVPWEFQYRLRIIKEIGQGYYGRVYKAEASGLPGYEGLATVAVKTVKENASGSELEDLIAESRVLQGLDHPNVIRFLGVFTKNGSSFIIMEYAKNGSLREYLKNHEQEILHREMVRKNSQIHTSLPTRDIVDFAWQIAKGMSYISESRLVHRDLAARNVLLTKEFVCKISDFGLTRDVYINGKYMRESSGALPVKYMAPESLFHNIYTTQSDVWSYGILLWELVNFGKEPYPGVPSTNMSIFLKQGRRMGKPKNCSKKFYEIMKSCWKKTPLSRPRFKELVQKLDAMLKSEEYLVCNPETDIVNLNSAQTSSRPYIALDEL